MTTPRDPDRQIHAFLLEGDDVLNDQIYDVVRAEIEHKRQRAFVGPWRTPLMNKLVTYGLGAAAVVLLIFAGSQFFGSSGGTTGAGETPTPEPTATPTLEPSPSPASLPPLTQDFTSTLYGITVSYPEGWSAQAATEHWTHGTFPLSFPKPQVDWLYDPILTSDLFLAIASQPIGDATPDEWVAAQMASDEGCGTATEPITVDGAKGLIGLEFCSVAVVTTGGRGYWIQFYTGSEAPAIDLQAFEEVLATVQLQPKEAVD